MLLSSFSNVTSNLNYQSQAAFKSFYKGLIMLTTYSKNNMGQKCEGNCGLRVLKEIITKMIEPFGIYLLNSTANPAHFYSDSAGLAI